MLFLLNDNDLNVQAGAVLYFYAPWLLFNRQALDRLAIAEKAHPSLPFYGIDALQFKTIVDRFRVVSVPTLILLRENGELIEKIVGLKEVLTIEDILADIYSTTTQKMKKSKGKKTDAQKIP